MKKPFVFIALISFLLLIVPIISSLLFYNVSEYNKTDKIDETNKVKQENKVKNYERINKKSEIINVYNVKKNKIETMELEKYLYGVVSCEMLSTFDLEALKAQAISARTYVIYKQQNNITLGHKGAVVCTDPSHCQAYKSYQELKKSKGEKWIKTDYRKIKRAVDETKGQIITYKNKPILPLYFSTSSGKTENSKDVFSTQYPYLVSVSSPYEKNAPKYLSTYSINKEKFIKIIKNNYPKSVISLENINKDISIINRTDGGCVKTIKIGNIKLRGIDVRKILNLNSANFTITYNENNIIFKVKGYGHGVGMSQWGAEEMAKRGYKYYDIVFHYFKQTDIKDLY